MLNCNGYDVCVWDLGGPEKCRPLWRHYFENAKALIFVVDASNTELLPKLKSEISQILREQALSKNLPVLILSNKHEAENALTIDDLTQGLDVRSIKQNTQIVEISAKTGDGIIDSIKWLRSSIKSK